MILLFLCAFFSTLLSKIAIEFTFLSDFSLLSTFFSTFKKTFGHSEPICPQRHLQLSSNRFGEGWRHVLLQEAELLGRSEQQGRPERNIVFVVQDILK